MDTVIKTDRGKVRKINEDYAGSFKIGPAHIFIIADGMGGHLAGEVASKLAVDSITSYIKNHENLLEKPLTLIKNAINFSNSTIYEKSKEPQYNNMGTTCELVIVIDDYCYIGHVGDSRVYINYQGKFIQITRDHSLINDLLDSGSVSEEEAEKMPQKNIITRALGGEDYVEIDYHELDFNKGDSLFMCTDGISGAVDKELLEEIIKNKNLTPENKANKIIDLANQAGGYDNLTLILVEKR